MTQQLTGRKVLLIAVSAFAVIVGVNLVMAWKAVSTFPGLETPNSYVTSQTFDRDRTAQEALGWRVESDYDGRYLSFVVRDKAGLPARIEKLDVLVGRTTMSAQDQRPELTYSGGIWSAPIALEPWAWLIHFEATAADGTLFRQRLDFFVEG